MKGGRDREAQRQQALMAVLLGDAEPESLAGWTTGSAAGLDAYRAHAAAQAERSLAAAYPTVRELVGHEAFAVLARRLWQDDPPRAGDLALWGAGLPDWIAGAPALAGEPYLADVARLDGAVHAAAQAGDAAMPAGLERLADGDPAALRLRLAPGTALVVSAWPVATIRAAHCRADGSAVGEGFSDGARAGDPDDAAAAAARWQAARAALAARQGENALVFRRGWRVGVDRIDDATARFTAALLAGLTLAAALDAGGAGFDFERWLVGALRAGRIAAVDLAG